MKINFSDKNNNNVEKTSFTNQIDTLNNFTRDEINMNLWGLNLSVSRETTSKSPSELSVFIPRAEFRDKEIILNSITIVIAPRH